MANQKLTERSLATGVTINDLIHIVITGDTTDSPQGSSYKATISQVSETIGGYQNYIEVNVTSADILDSNTTPFELLPAPGVGKYYDAKFIVEYDYNTTQYNVGGINLTFIYDGTNYVYQVCKLDTLNNDTVLFPRIEIGSSIYAVGGMNLNSPLYLYTENADPTTGNGTMLFKIWYTIRTVG
jgi:hypothetical protein